MTHDELQQLKPGDTVKVTRSGGVFDAYEGTVTSVKRLGAFVAGIPSWGTRNSEEFFLASEMALC